MNTLLIMIIIVNIRYYKMAQILSFLIMPLCNLNIGQAIPVKGMGRVRTVIYNQAA